MPFAPGEILLETRRLVLRRFTPADAPLLFELDSDPEVRRFLLSGPTPMEQIEREVLPRFLAYYQQKPPRGFWAAHLLETSTFAGWFHLRPDRFAPGEMELGYRLRRAVWGQGLATEGSRALLEKAFGPWAYAKVSARTLVVNRASRRVMEKLGMLYESEFVYPLDLIPGYSEDERRAVKYSIRNKLPCIPPHDCSSNSR
jgi:RimJ/RimL family protein N-acetyltransferase